MGRRGLTSCPALFCKLLTLHKDLAQMSFPQALPPILRKKINCPQLIFAPIALCTKLYYSYYALTTLNCYLSAYVSVYFHKNMHPQG